MSATKNFRLPKFSQVLLAFVLFAGFARGVSMLAADADSTAKAAPAWKLEDLEGKEISSDQFKGKVVVVDFWATWCGPCIQEIPGYIELQKKYGSAGLVIVGISVDQAGPDKVKAFVKAKGINYTIVMADDVVADAFGGISAIPTTFLINREGQIVHQTRGAMSHEAYAKLVEQAMR